MKNNFFEPAKKSFSGLDPDKIKTAADGCGHALEVMVFENVGSTNQEMRERARAGAPQGEVIAAAAQSAGRGRRGRCFYSPAGDGLYMSLLLRPEISPEEVPLITIAAAVATAEAISNVSHRETKIKWVNDIFLDGGKVCGILTEAETGSGGGIDYAVLGIGVNLCVPQGGFPEEIKNTAAALFSGQEGCDCDKNILCGRIISRFFGYYDRLGAREYIRKYRDKSNLIGQNITVLRGDESLPAFAFDIDDNGRLGVKYPDGREEYLSSGEVSVRL